MDRHFSPVGMWFVSWLHSAKVLRVKGSMRSISPCSKSGLWFLHKETMLLCSCSWYNWKKVNRVQNFSVRKNKSCFAEVCGTSWHENAPRFYKPFSTSNIPTNRPSSFTMVSECSWAQICILHDMSGGGTSSWNGNDLLFVLCICIEGCR